MARVLVTGMSGTGKSTVLIELTRRGFLTVDSDYGHWTSPDDTWNEARMAGLLTAQAQIVVSGTVANQGRFYDRFDHVVLLAAPLNVRLMRVAVRKNNPYGKTGKQQGEIKRNLAEVEPLLRRGATLELDGRLPVADLADRITKLLI